VSRSLNKVMLIGNVGADPEIRTIPSGARVAQFSLATSRRWKDKSGQQQEKVEWHRINVWDGLVDVVENYVKKGDRLYVEGSIEYRQYQDKDGVTKYATEIRGREIILNGGNRPEAGGTAGEAAHGARRTEPAMAGAGASTGGSGGGYDDYQAPAFEDDDDLPF
jgi:single-strand DNA-binding protein